MGREGLGSGSPLGKEMFPSDVQGCGGEGAGDGLSAQHEIHGKRCVLFKRGRRESVEDMESDYDSDTVAEGKNTGGGDEPWWRGVGVGAWT